jgi:hypothetical protein
VSGPDFQKREIAHVVFEMTTKGGKERSMLLAPFLLADCLSFSRLWVL